MTNSLLYDRGNIQHIDLSDYADVLKKIVSYVYILDRWDRSCISIDGDRYLICPNVRKQVSLPLHSIREISDNAKININSDFIDHIMRLMESSIDKIVYSEFQYLSESDFYYWHKDSSGKDNRKKSCLILFGDHSMGDPIKIKDNRNIIHHLSLKPNSCYIYDSSFRIEQSMVQSGQQYFWLIISS